MSIEAMKQMVCALELMVAEQCHYSGRPDERILPSLDAGRKAIAEAEKQEPVIKEFTQIVDFVRDIEVEKVKFQLSYGTEELSETPRRIGFFIASQTFGSTMKEYFDDVQSLRELQKLIEVFLNSVNAKEVKPEQEPVAVVKGYMTSLAVHIVGEVKEGDLLYTTPPQRKPLTDGQREEIAKGWRGRNWTLGDVIDAVETAHDIKEKNNDVF